MHSVGVPRFELGTSRTRTVRSTGLSHTPIADGLYTHSPRFGKPDLRIEPDILGVDVNGRIQQRVHLAHGETRQSALSNFIGNRG